MRRRLPSASAQVRREGCLFVWACPDRQRGFTTMRCIAAADRHPPSPLAPPHAGRVACSTPSPRRRYGAPGAQAAPLAPPPPGHCGSLPIATPGGRRLWAFRCARSRLKESFAKAIFLPDVALASDVIDRRPSQHVATMQASLTVVFPIRQ